MASAQVFQSGFEDWTGTAPDGWGTSGVSNIGAANITQVSENVHSGTYAVRLTNAATGHKRFATSPLEVTSGQNYEVTFWVRGNGEVRVGLFDGRPGTSAGYAGYTPYTVVASPDTWTQVTRSIAAANDTTDGQFILSVRNTVAPEQLVVDDVNITLAAPLTPTSIYNIQYTTDPTGASPLNGQTVLTGGIVSADIPGTNNGYFVQSGSGPWSGITVFDTDHSPAIGDSVTFMATVSEFNSNTELTGISSYVVVSSGNPLVAFDVATGDVSLEPLESVLIRVVNASCTEVPGGANFGKYKVNDGTGDAVIGKAIYTTTPDPMIGNILDITGVNYFAYGEYNIQPRMTSDVDFLTGISAAGVLSTVQVGPNPATNILNVSLGQAAGSQVEYTLTDMQGRMVQNGQFFGAQGQLNVNDMATGLYHLTLRSSELVKTFTVQVAR